VGPAVDPVSGEPEFKHTPARVAPYAVAWQGFVLSRRPVLLRDATTWSVTPGEHCWRYELAGRRVFADWSPWAKRMLDAPSAADWLEYVDRGTGVYRAAALREERLEACVFLSPRPDLPSRSWLAGLFAQASLSPADRRALLAGRPARAGADAGEIVCACFRVGRITIGTTIRELRLTSAAQVGERLKAGTNCGSCLAEIKALVASGICS
jgi:assimilatory nitrate reductase catalytic subunit